MTSQNNENYAISKTPHQNHAHHENSIIPRKNQENLKQIIEFHPIFTKIKQNNKMIPRQNNENHDIPRI